MTISHEFIGLGYKVWVIRRKGDFVAFRTTKECAKALIKELDSILEVL